MTYYDFKEYKIRDIAEIISGGTPKTSEETYWGEEISWITPKDLSSHKKVYIEHGARNISKKGLLKSSAKLLPAGTVLLSTRAPIGYVAIAKKEMTTNQGFKNLVLNENFDNHYIYYLLSNSKEYLEGHASGTTFKELSANTLKNIRLQIPNIEAQRNIGKILYTIDKKIELNNDVIKNLESMGNLLFKHWFIDFEFPNEEGQPYKSSGGKMVESELGMIPEGWQPLSLEELVDDTIGGDWGKDSPQDNYKEKVHVIRGADLNDLNKGIYTKMPERYILPKNYRNKKSRPLDLIIEISGGSPTQSTGRISLITNEVIDKFDDKLISTNFCRIIRLKDVTYSMFFFNWWKFFYEKNIFFQYENGTTGIKNLDLKSFLKNNIVAIPENSRIEKFNQLNSNVLNNIFSLSEENIKLTQLRDTLLPKLLSGEIEVPVKEPESV